MIKKTNVYKLGELFSGPGGFAEGARKSRVFEHVWANDIDPMACKTFELNHPNTRVFPGDINDEFIPNMKGKKKIDGLVFGFPCNDFSLVGKKQKLKGKYGPLYKSAITVLDHFKPNFFIAENVTAISPINEKNKDSEVYKNFLTIMSELSKAAQPNGYKVYADRYKFEQFGVPQTRHRMILVGFRADYYKKNNINYYRPKEDTENPDDFVTCKTALEKGVPGTKQIGLIDDLENPLNHEHTKHSSDVKLRLENTKEGQNVWDIEDKFGLPGVTKARMSHIYKKLDSSKPSYTVTGSGGGGTHVYHYKENRALTNRERARIQTFDDKYKFVGKKEEVRKQIGMAVPVLAAKKILKSVYDSLKKHKKQINNDTSFHDWTINPNSEKLIMKTINTHEQFLKEFGIHTNEKKRRNK